MLSSYGNCQLDYRKVSISTQNSMNRKFRRLYLFLLPLFCLIVALSWQGELILERPALALSSSPVKVEQNLGPPVTVVGDEPIEPIPQQIEVNANKVVLGNKLFHDPQLSHNNTISCATCHSLNKGGVDRRTLSVGIDGKVGKVNAPTVLNNSLHFKQFWDGRAASLESQIDGPINSDFEMGSNWSEITEKLKRSSAYVTQFEQLYPDGITSTNIKDSIATFERSLTTPDSAFDRFLRGDASALTAEQKEGYSRFKDLGCVSCHQGILLGGNMYQKFGVFGDYFKDRGNITESDYGRFNVTKQEEDRFAFKVQSLRNVELTPPYFHDGSAETLDKAVKVMIKYQIGREVAQKDIDLIIKFLTSLTGKLQGVS